MNKHLLIGCKPKFLTIEWWMTSVSCPKGTNTRARIIKSAPPRSCYFTIFAFEPSSLSLIPCIYTYHKFSDTRTRKISKCSRQLASPCERDFTYQDSTAKLLGGLRNKTQPAKFYQPNHRTITSSNKQLIWFSIPVFKIYRPLRKKRNSQNIVNFIFFSKKLIEYESLIILKPSCVEPQWFIILCVINGSFHVMSCGHAIRFQTCMDLSDTT